MFIKLIVFQKFLFELELNYIIVFVIYLYVQFYKVIIINIILYFEFCAFS